MRALSKSCMEILEDAAFSCDIESIPNPEDWEWEDNFIGDEEAERECFERGLTISLPCLGCFRIYQDAYCHHHHLTMRGIVALHFYRENKELLK